MQERARLEAFLAAFPGEYCGWPKDGSAVYSRGFCRLLEIGTIRTIADIQHVLEPGDAAALEGLFDRLQKTGTAFSITVKTVQGDKTLRISGSQGRDLAQEDQFNIIWAEDITEEIKARTLFIEESEDKDKTIDLLYAMLDTIPRPVWIRDAEQNITWCNVTYAEFLGRDKEHIITEQLEVFGQLRRKKMTENEIMPGRDMAAHALQYRTAIEARTHGIVKGARMLMNIAEIPMGAREKTLGIAYNVTREEELENELKRYQSSNRDLLEHLRSAIAIYDLDQNLAFYNTAFSLLWNLESTWLDKNPKLGDIMEKLRELRQLPEQIDFRKFKQSWQEMFTGLINPHEDLLHLPDGKTVRMLVVPHSMGGLMMTFEDVTSRLQLESSYNTLVAVQKETLDNLAEGVAVYGGDGRLKLYNPAFSRLWKLNPEDMEGEPHITRLIERKKSFFPPEKWHRKREILLAMGLERALHEGRFERVDDTLIDFATVPLPDGGVLVTFEDVTDSVRVENALREKNAALEAAEKLKHDFLANVSYQLRTPLNAIMGFNEILDREYFGALNERQHEYTRDIAVASDKLLGLINDILDLSTLEAGYMTLDRIEVNVYKMLHSVFDLVAEWARKQKIEMDIKCPKNIGTIHMDERRMQQAVINLIRNAIAFTPPGGQITLSARRTKDGLYITVEDTGSGISKEDMARIFEPFERSKSPFGTDSGIIGNKGGGAGLGLSLVRNIIALHGGDVQINSEVKQGTTVTLFIPYMAVVEELSV